MNKLMEHVVEKFAQDFDSAAVAALVDRRVLEERERCAKIAEAAVCLTPNGDQSWEAGWNSACDTVVELIRDPNLKQ